MASNPSDTLNLDDQTFTFHLDFKLPERPGIDPTFTVADFATPEAACETSYTYARDYGIEPKAPWVLDDARVADAKEVLGLTWPLEIHLGDGNGPELSSSVASYLTDRCTLDAGLFSRYEHAWDQDHLIWMRNHYGGICAVMASCSLWHELAHATQAERLGAPYALYKAVTEATDYRGAQAAVRNGSLECPPEYLANPFEYEAFKHNRFHFDHFPLTVPA